MQKKIISLDENLINKFIESRTAHINNIFLTNEKKLIQYQTSHQTENK